MHDRSIIYIKVNKTLKKLMNYYIAIVHELTDDTANTNFINFIFNFIYLEINNFI